MPYHTVFFGKIWNIFHSFSWTHCNRSICVFLCFPTAAFSNNFLIHKIYIRLWNNGFYIHSPFITMGFSDLFCVFGRRREHTKRHTEDFQILNNLAISFLSDSCVSWKWFDICFYVLKMKMSFWMEKFT